MASYTARLNQNRPFAGVQVTLSTPMGKRIRSTVSDSSGVYSFYDVISGSYVLNFYGGDYTSNDSQNIYIVNPQDIERYEIVTPDGTTLKDKNSTLSVYLTRVYDGNRTTINHGNVKIYFRSGEYILPLESIENATAYQAVLPLSEIGSSLTLFAIRDFEGPDEFFFHTATLASLDRGPGPLYIGPFSELDLDRALNNSDMRDVVSGASETEFYAYAGEHGVLVSEVNFPEDFEEIPFFDSKAISLLITRNSYIQEVLNIGTNPEGSSSNITLSGLGANPYLSIGQSAKVFNATGIWMGTDSGIAKLSLRHSNGDFFRWDQNGLTVHGNAFFERGLIGGWSLLPGEISSGNGIKKASIKSVPDAQITFGLKTSFFSEEMGAFIGINPDASPATGSLQVTTSGKAFGDSSPRTFKLLFPEHGEIEATILRNDSASVRAVKIKDVIDAVPGFTASIDTSNSNIILIETPPGSQYNGQVFIDDREEGTFMQPSQVFVYNGQNIFFTGAICNLSGGNSGDVACMNIGGLDKFIKWDGNNLYLRGEVDNLIISGELKNASSDYTLDSNGISIRMLDPTTNFSFSRGLRFTSPDFGDDNINIYGQLFQSLGGNWAWTLNFDVFNLDSTLSDVSQSGVRFKFNGDDRLIITNTHLTHSSSYQIKGKYFSFDGDEGITNEVVISGTTLSFKNGILTNVQS